VEVEEKAAGENAEAAAKVAAAQAALTAETQRRYFLRSTAFITW